MSYLELFQIVSKPWASIKEISLIANCGRDAAIKIRNKIKEEIIKDGKKIPKGKTIVVPTEKVLEYLGLNIDYIVSMADTEAKLNDRTLSYASISR